MTKVSDFTQNHIFNCYKLMIEFITEGNPEDIDEFCKMNTQIEIELLTIPDELAQKIKKIVDDVIAPMSFESAEVFHKAYSHADNTGPIMEYKEDKDFMDGMADFFEELDARKNIIEKFAREEMRPYLV